MRLVKATVMAVAFVLASYAVPALAALVSSKTGISIHERWWELFLWTCFVAAFVCQHLRFYLRYKEFWLRFVPVMLIHLVAFFVLLRSYPQWRVTWFMPIVFPEALLLAGGLEGVLMKRFR